MLIIFAVIMGIWTAVMALFVPDTCSLHDIAVTEEWWILPAILIIVNCKKPLESALKVFVFFLISQPLVFLVQVPFNQMGWGLFGYYPYWFKLTLLTFPAAFVGWFMKKDNWYSGLILSFATVLLSISGIGYARIVIEEAPHHLLSMIYCFAMIPFLILGILKKKTPRFIATVITVVAMIGCLVLTNGGGQFESYNNQFTEEYDISFVGEPYISYFSGTGDGNAELIIYDEGYTLKLMGVKRGHYNVSLSDDSGAEYNFEYYYDKDQDTVVLKLKE